MNGGEQPQQPGPVQKAIGGALVLVLVVAVGCGALGRIVGVW